MNFKQQAIDAYDEITDEDVKRAIQWVISRYHIRNGVKNNDGSIGEIRISPKEMQDLLAYMITMGNRENEE